MREAIAESDWKLSRKLHPIALDRFCHRVLEEIASIGSDTSKTSHERYGAIYRLIKRRDREIADSFDGMSRSQALIRILALRRLGLFTDDEFGQFSEEMRGEVERIFAIASR